MFNPLNAVTIYRISSNRHHPRIVAAQSEALDRNECHPRIVAAASKRSTCTRVRMISDDGHHRILLCTDLRHEKKITGLPPNVNFLYEI